jgi:hypothetical protein
MREESEKITQFKMEPTVGSTPPWAGVTPAPGTRRICGTSSLLGLDEVRTAFRRVRFPFPRGKGLGVRFL